MTISSWRRSFDEVAPAARRGQRRRPPDESGARAFPAAALHSGMRSGGPLAEGSRGFGPSWSGDVGSHRSTWALGHGTGEEAAHGFGAHVRRAPRMWRRALFA
ncbi:unnamed protein product [Prorocentrum cordatum]|uniref:Uncharacterized protein n=1 Tax=Prorocentrum cordatum TaxID=2364126 RepID=A0ABN9U9Q4_9DINO|nr:unnamed protein product [Polarella glacialis]